MSSSGAGGSNNNNNAGPGPNANNDNDHQEVVPVANVGGGGGVNFPRFRGDETEYFLWVIQDSVWLTNSNIQTLLTRRDMVVTYMPLIRPDPPALYMLPRDRVINGLDLEDDGYDWLDTKYYNLKIDGVEVITVVTSRNTRELIDHETIVRKIYGLIGDREMVLVHYKAKVPGDDDVPQM